MGGEQAAAVGVDRLHDELIERGAQRGDAVGLAPALEADRRLAALERGEPLLDPRRHLGRGGLRERDRDDAAQHALGDPRRLRVGLARARALPARAQTPREHARDEDRRLARCPRRPRSRPDARTRSARGAGCARPPRAGSASSRVAHGRPPAAARARARRARARSSPARRAAAHAPSRMRAPLSPRRQAERRSQLRHAPHLFVAVGPAQPRHERARVERREQRRDARFERGAPRIDRVASITRLRVVVLGIEVDITRARAVLRVGVRLDQLAARQAAAVILQALRACPSSSRCGAARRRPRRRGRPCSAARAVGARLVAHVRDADRLDAARSSRPRPRRAGAPPRRRAPRSARARARSRAARCPRSRSARARPRAGARARNECGHALVCAASASAPCTTLPSSRLSRAPGSAPARVRRRSRCPGSARGTPARGSSRRPRAASRTAPRGADRRDRAAGRRRRGTARARGGARRAGRARAARRVARARAVRCPPGRAAARAAHRRARRAAPRRTRRACGGARSRARDRAASAARAPTPRRTASVRSNSGDGGAARPVRIALRAREMDLGRRRDELREQEALLLVALALDRQIGEHVAQRAAQRVGQQRVLRDAAREHAAVEPDHAQRGEAARARLHHGEHLDAAAASRRARRCDASASARRSRRVQSSRRTGRSPARSNAATAASRSARPGVPRSSRSRSTSSARRAARAASGARAGSASRRRSAAIALLAQRRELVGAHPPPRRARRALLVEREPDARREQHAVTPTRRRRRGEIGQRWRSRAVQRVAQIGGRRCGAGAREASSQRSAGIAPPRSSSSHSAASRRPAGVDPAALSRRPRTERRSGASWRRSASR